MDTKKTANSYIDLLKRLPDYRIDMFTKHIRQEYGSNKPYSEVEVLREYCVENKVNFYIALAKYREFVANNYEAIQAAIENHPK